MFFSKKLKTNTTNNIQEKQDINKNTVDNAIRIENLNFKCEQFFGKNWKYVFFFMIFVGLIVAYELSNLSSSMQELKNTVEENNAKVVLTTTDGRAIKVTKEPLKAEYLKQFALSTYVNNFVVSRSHLTDNFSKVNFTKYSDILENVPTLQNIYQNFLDSEKKENQEIDKVAVGDFIAYIQWLMSAVARDALPEYMSVKDYSLDNYEYNQNTFKIEINIKIVAQSYILARDEYIKQNGNFKIISEGSFDLAKSTDVNPYGMRIKRIKIEPVVKNVGNK